MGRDPTKDENDAPPLAVMWIQKLHKHRQYAIVLTLRIAEKPASWNSDGFERKMK